MAKFDIGRYHSQNFNAFPQPHIRYRGVWDMQDLYETCINYFRDRKYKFHEKTYKHKHPSPFGHERQMTWQAVKKVDDVYDFKIDMYMHQYDAEDVQVKTKTGELKTFTKGRLWIEINSSIKLYSDERWTQNRFYATVRNFINTYLKRKKHGWEVWDIIMYREVQRLVWLIRRRLKMEYDEYEQKHWMGVHA